MDIVERIEKLSGDFKELSVLDSLSETPSVEFLELQKIARQEAIANLHYIEKYGLSTYLTLQKLSIDPTNKYYKLWIGKNFKQLYLAKKNYQLNRYVDRIVPEEQDASYQQFLNFIWNLKLNELESISDHYSKSN